MYFKYIYIYIYNIESFINIIVRTQIDSQAQKMYELRSKEPNTMNL